jgi:hypothetical protein
MCTCGHDRRQHDKSGCADYKDGKPCPCKRKYMDMRGKR